MRISSRAFPPFALALLFAFSGAAQSQQPPVAPPAAQPAAPGAKTFSQQDLDTLMAPIALYPDSLLAQILMASTYPLEIVEAARWAKANPTVKDKALQDAMEAQKWDPSVKALTAVPKVLEQMNEKLDWTQKLGDAFLAQQADVMTTVQALRTKAAAAGNLKSSPEATVKTEEQAGKTVYVIESPKSEVVYVPTYNPYTVYGSWWYAAPPYYMYPPGYAYAPGLAFATGIVVGAAIWGNANWGGNNVNVNVNKYNNFNKTNIQNSNFQHNAEHRKGVAYKDQGTAQKYNRGASQSAQSREDFRGRSESGGGASARTADSGRGGQAGSASQRSAGESRGGGGGGGGGFSGAGSGASTRAASSRGASSRGGGGGGGGRRR